MFCIDIKWTCSFTRMTHGFAQLWGFSLEMKRHLNLINYGLLALKYNGHIAIIIHGLFALKHNGHIALIIYRLFALKRN